MVGEAAPVNFMNISLCVLCDLCFSVFTTAPRANTQLICKS
jgi:hypothetical protein